MQTAKFAYLTMLGAVLVAGSLATGQSSPNSMERVAEDRLLDIIDTRYDARDAFNTEEDYLTDNVWSREFSFFNQPLIPYVFTDAVSREFSFFNAPLVAYEITDATSREFSFFNAPMTPYEITDAVSREFSFFNAPMVAYKISDAVSREFSFQNDTVVLDFIENTVSREFSYYMPFADLAATIEDAPSSAQIGDSIDVYWSVTNEGDHIAEGPWTDQVYLSEDNTWDTGDTLLASLEFTGNLAVDESSGTLSATATLPDEAGDYYLLVVADAGRDVFEDDLNTNNVAAAPFALTPIPQPDLAIATLTTPSEATGGESIIVEYSVENFGTLDAVTPWQDAIYLSADETFDPETDELLRLDPIAEAPLAPGEFYSRSKSVTLPVGFASTNAFIIAVTDVGLAVDDANRANNAMAGHPLHLLIPPAPDLVAADVDTVDLATFGDQINVSWTGQNIGDEDATGLWTDVVVLSADQTIGPEDRVIGSLSIDEAPLSPGDTPYERSLDVTLPLDVNSIAGDYYIFVVTDGNDAIDESDEQNNAAFYGPVTIDLPPLPDLTITGVAGPANVSVGQAASITWYANNVGGLSTDGSFICTVSARLAGDTDSTPLANVPYEDLLNSGSNAFMATEVVVPDLGDGTVEFIVCSDTFEDILEANEENNCASSDSPSVYFRPDLAIQPFDAPATAVAGQTASFSFMVENTGNATALPYWIDAVYVSADTTIGGDILLSTSAHTTELTTNGFYTVNATVRIPSNLLGDYYFIAQTDHEGRIVETGDDSNNMVFASAPTQISQPPLPNLTVNSITLPPTGLSGQIHTLEFDIRNIGTVPAEGFWADRVYASTDRIVGANDMILGDFQNVSDLGSNGTYTQIVDIEYPSQPGDYYIIVTTDQTDTINEGVQGGESNNTTASTDRITVTTFEATDATATVTRGTSVEITGHAVIAGTTTHADDVPVVVRVKVGDFERKITGRTNGAGEFAVTFEPGPTEGGRYYVHAGPTHIPTASLPALTQFDIYTLVTNPDLLEVRALPNIPTEGSFILKNPGNLPQTGIDWSINGLPSEVLDLTLVSGNNLLGNASTTVNYTLTLAEDTTITPPIEITFTSSEDAVVTLPLQLTIGPADPTVIVVPEDLDANGKAGGTIIRGQRSYHQVRVRNVGAGTSDDLQVTLPASFPWISLATPNPLEPIGPNQEAAIILQLDPPANLALGTYHVPVQVQYAAGKSVTINFEFIATSIGVGQLYVVVTDQFTYYDEANGYPKVSGASIRLYDTISGNLIAMASSDSEGEVLFDAFTEAYYDVEVTAPDHGPFRSMVFVRGGQRTDIEAFLPRDSVTYSWSVVPTDIEDEYRISIEAEFQTNVPMPVVVIEPAMIDLDALELPTQIDFTITNYGLITAQNVQIHVTNNNQVEFIPLVTDIGDLPGGCTPQDPYGPCRVTVPVLLVPPADKAGGDCTAAGVGGCYELVCGDETYTFCVGSSTSSGVCPGMPGSAVATGGGQGAGGSFEPPEGVSIDLPCDFCFDEEKAEKCAKALIGCGPIPCIPQGYDCGNGPWGSNPGRAARNCAAGMAGCGVDAAIGAACPLCSGVSCACSLIRDCTPTCVDTGCVPCSVGDIITMVINGDPCLGGKSGLVSPFDQPLYDEAYTWYWRSLTMTAATYYPFGDMIWAETTEPELLVGWLQAFEATVQSDSEDGERISATERAALLTTMYPSILNATDVEKFLDRWNRTYEYNDQGIYNMADVPAGWSTDFIADDEMQFLANQVMEDQQAALDAGFDSVMEALDYYLIAVAADATESGDGICATVRIKIDQTATLTRSAFRATLELGNSGGEPLEGVLVDIVIKDANGNVATNLFGFRDPELLGSLTGVDGTGSLPGGTDGSSNWIIIPTNEAAPLAPTTYFVSGSVQYSIAGNLATIPLYPVQIDVLPNPNLELNYFLETVVYSDDPFTPELEPAIPFSLGLMVKNSGAGVARNMRITSAQPEIIENEKGLIIDFDIIGTHVGNDQLSPSLTVDLGDIGADSTAVARWLMISTLQGEFISFEATFEHVDSLGDPRLSLIDSVDIFALNHVVQTDEFGADGIAPDDLPDFLTNDYPDIADLPDRIHHSDGRVESVSPVLGAGVTSDEPTLSATITTPMAADWTYIRIDDPFNARYRLSSVMRGDGKNIQLGTNAWQTSRINRSIAGSPVERYIHIFDRNGPGQYTLSFDPDGTPPEVLAWRSVAEHGALGEVGITIEPGIPGSEPRISGIRKLTVTFSEPINPATFTSANVVVDGVDLAGDPIAIPSLTTTLIDGDTVGVVEFSETLPSGGRYCITLTDVADYAGNLAAGAGIRADISAIPGDATGDRRVNNTDVGGAGTLISTDPIERSNLFAVRSDVDTNGYVNNDDIAIILANRGNDARYLVNPCLNKMDEEVMFDTDTDDDVDLYDLAAFADCFGGPQNGTPASCDSNVLMLDWDADKDVDLADFAAFQRSFSGHDR